MLGDMVVGYLTHDPADVLGSEELGRGSVLAWTLTKSSIASWFPCIAPRSCCISGGGGRSCANSSVNS